MKLTASTHAGYEFVRWKGTGDVYDSNGNVRDDVCLDAPDDEPERWVTDSTIYIKMAKRSSPYEPADRSITAMARGNCEDVTPGGQWHDLLGVETCWADCDDTTLSRAPHEDECNNMLLIKCVKPSSGPCGFNYFFRNDVGQETLVGVCVYDCGVNYFEYMLNIGGRRIVKTRHSVHDNPLIVGCDQGVIGSYDWQVYVYDVVNSTTEKIICGYGSTPSFKINNKPCDSPWWD